MPRIVDLYNKYKEYIKGMTIIRLHGPDRSCIEKISNKNWHKIYNLSAFGGLTAMPI